MLSKPHLRAIVIAFAARRLTTLIVEDKVTERLRAAWWRRYPEETPLGYIPTCRNCSSVWAAGAVTLLGLLTLGEDHVLPHSPRHPVPAARHLLKTTSRICLATLAVSEAVLWGDRLADAVERHGRTEGHFD
jgi:hypothetical protein